MTSFDVSSEDAEPFDDGAVDRLLGVVNFNDQGLVAAVVQQYDSGEVLMAAWMDSEALRRTVAEGRTTFFSRSRHEYWRKGDTSGHQQWVKKVCVDCDGDALLILVNQIGVACHTGTRTCFDAHAYEVVADK